MQQWQFERRQFPGGMRVLVKGFVSNMAEWMSACNVIVTKAGPGTIAEALICGLPIVLNGFIPCQARLAPLLESVSSAGLVHVKQERFVGG